jgi:hypothetical protein
MFTSRQYIHALATHVPTLLIPFCPGAQGDSFAVLSLVPFVYIRLDASLIQIIFLPLLILCKLKLLHMQHIYIF